MMSKIRVTIIPVTVGVLLLVGRPAVALSWTTVARPTAVPGGNCMYGADARAGNDAWAVGLVYPPTGGSRGALGLRYDGSAWVAIARTGLPGDDLLRGVAAASATDVWVAGDHRAG